MYLANLLYTSVYSQPPFEWFTLKHGLRVKSALIRQWLKPLKHFLSFSNFLPSNQMESLGDLRLLYESFVIADKEEEDGEADEMDNDDNDTVFEKQ